MSAFNTLVPFTDAHKLLVDAFDWDINMGRIRYIWISEDGKQGYILFKDGPTSWSANTKQVEEAVRNHHAFMSYDVIERDPVYTKATFDLTKTVQYTQETMDLILEVAAMGKKTFGDDYIAVTEDPFDIFDRNLKALNNGTLSPELMKGVEALTKKIQDGIDNGDQIIIT